MVEEPECASSISSENLRFQVVIAVVGVTLMVIKFAAWMLTSSVSILTDATESIVNVVAAFIGLYALYLSSKPRDRDHPYGHGKVELLSSLAEGMMILVAGLVIIFEAIDSMMDPEEIRQLDIGLILLVIAAAVNFIVGYAAIRKGKRNRSVALVASGKHLCSDTLSSVGIIIGVGLMMVLEHFGHEVYWLDSIIAAVFGAIIFIAGIRVVKTSMDGVMDRSDTGLVSEVIGLINSRRHDHWVDIHNLRIIKYGPLIHIELHMIFPRDMTVEQQYTEVTELNEAIRAEYGDNLDVTIMGEPCDGSLCRSCASECGYRTEAFVGRIEWTVETATDRDHHHGSADIDE